MISEHTYQVFDSIERKTVLEGTAKDVAKFIGTSVQYVASCAREQRPMRKGRYYIVDVTEAVKLKSAPSPNMLAAARKWDEFVTPIREYYGIPVYRPGKR